MSTYNLEFLSLNLRNVQSEFVTYRNRPAIRLIELNMMSNEESIAILTDLNFKNGMIEAEVAGSPRLDAPMDMRGFVGIAFRVQPNGSSFECFFIRPTNGRANDQLRRNHSTQYISHPDYPWYRLREEHPGVYESYTDLIPGEWTRIKIVVSGIHAQLFVNDSEQPCLIVNDLKLGEIEGKIALWVGAGTEAYFSNVQIKPID